MLLKEIFYSRIMLNSSKNMISKNNLPYFKTTDDKEISKFLRKKFLPGLKKIFPCHFLIQPNHFKNLQKIKILSGKFPYFLRFDISLYYPSISHEILIKEISKVYEEICKKPVSKRLDKYLKKDIPAFLKQSPYQKGLPIGSSLSHILSGIFLLPLDLRIKNPFLRYNDDYLIFCRNGKEPELILKKVVIPTLKELNLELNCKKLISGRFNRDRVSFIGFEFFSGYFSIQREKYEQFKKEIKRITGLNRKKRKEAIIKSLNNKILGFGHYYKFASCINDFNDLDSFIRMCLRRYLLKQRNLNPKEGNFVLTNEYLNQMGLKSIKMIKRGSKDKKPLKLNKVLKNSFLWKNVEDFSIKYKIDYIIKQIQILNTSAKRTEEKIKKIEKGLREIK